MPSTYVHMMNRSLMAKKETKPNSQSKYLSDSHSDDNEINPRLKTSIEERQYNTIPGLAIATHIALSYSRAQGESNCRQRTTTIEVKTKKPSTEDTKAETTSTSHKDK